MNNNSLKTAYLVANSIIIQLLKVQIYVALVD